MLILFFGGCMVALVGRQVLRRSDGYDVVRSIRSTRKPLGGIKPETLVEVFSGLP